MDGFVTTWYDQSGQGNDATQTVATSQPKIVDAGVLLVDANGKPEVVFDQSLDQYLDLDTSVQHKNVYLAAAANTANTGGVALAILGNDSAQNDSFIFMSHAGGSLAYAISIDGSSGDSGSWYLNGAFQSTGDNLGTFGDIVDGQTMLHCIEYSAGDPLQNANRLGMFSFNTDYTFDGSISEIIIYDSDQSSNRVAIEANINSEYSIY